MSELCDTLKKLVAEYPGTMTELARKAEIERSTLYKIVGGQRTPKAAQIARLSRALDLSDSDVDYLKSIYMNERSGTDRVACDNAIHDMLCCAMSPPVAPHTESSYTAPSAADILSARRTCCIHGRSEVLHTLWLLLADYLTGNESGPLMLSPGAGFSPFTETLLSDFAGTTQGKTVWQMLHFIPEKDNEDALSRNAASMSQALPFMFIPGAQYEARLAAVEADSSIPGSLLPRYVLFPHAAFSLDAACTSAICVSEPSIVEHLRLAYSRQYLESDRLLSASSPNHQYWQSINLNSQMLQPATETYYLRAQPLLSKFVDEDILYRCARSETAAQRGLSYLSTWCKIPFECYFSEEGLLDFVRTGRLCDVAEDLYKPLPPQDRRTLLQRMKDSCTLPQSVQRVVQPEAFRPDSSITITVYRNKGVRIYRRAGEHATAESFCRDYLLQDLPLVNRTADYMAGLKYSGSVHSQKYTIEFIDYCLNLI